MAGLGRKTFNSGDVLTSADVQGYLMDQAVMVFAGTAARGSAIPSPSAGMVAYSTATQLQVYNGSAWVDLSTGYGAATGGSSSSITVGGINYTLLTFTSDGTLTNTKAGLFDVLAFAGGGGGGSSIATVAGGGGGGGGYILQTIYLNANATIVVGAGGAALTNGLGSRVDGLSVAGGGLGSGTSPYLPPGVGGSGGGGSSYSGNTSRYLTGAAAIISSVSGFAGGTGSAVDYYGGAGGGGAGAVGAANASQTGGAGGAGYDVSTFIGGSALYKAGGGGGGSGNVGSGGAGGSSVGGAGGTQAAGNAASANTAGGGGGSAGDRTAAGGAGGSGIVYVRFRV